MNKPTGINRLDLPLRVKYAEQVQAELIEKVKKLDDREQEEMLEQLNKGGE